jgi:hypothetical protein
MEQPRPLKGTKVQTLVISHQTLGQFDRRLRKTVMTNTAIKMVGGISAEDADDMAKDMRCDSKYLLSMRKGADYSQFACWVKDHTEKPLPLTFQLGEMERRPQLTNAQYRELIERNRNRYSATGPDLLPDGDDTDPQPDGEGSSFKDKNNPDDDTDLL